MDSWTHYLPTPTMCWCQRTVILSNTRQ